MQLTDISVIKDICEKYGFSLSKGLGQNFIVNAGVCPKIAYGAEIDETYGVLEVGPGIGVLTKELSKCAKKVVAVELDDRLPAVLENTLAECDNVKIVSGDILKVDLKELIEQEFDGLKVAVCANLPYYITSPVIMKLLESKLPIESITVMVQKEAAERITAPIATRKAGAITYAVHYHATPEILFDVKPGSFYPPPKVTSSVIRLVPHREPPVKTNDEAHYFRTIRAAFNQRRKTAVNAISAGLSLPKATVITAFETTQVKLTARAEQITQEQYAALSNELCK